MNSKLFKSFTPALIGAVTVAAVGIPQAAQAGTVRAESRINFEDAVLTLNNNSIWDRFETTVQAGAEIDGMDPFNGDGPTACGSPSIDAFAEETMGTSFTRGGATVDCSDLQTVEASNFAELFLESDTQKRGSSVGDYTLVTINPFEVSEGDVIDFDATLSRFVEVEIAGFAGDPEIKTVEAEYLGAFEILLDGQTVFNGPAIADTAELANQNGIVSGGLNGANIDLPALQYTFEGDGEAEIRFSSVERVSGAINRANVPEPASILGLLAVGGALGFLKRRQSH